MLVKNIGLGMREVRRVESVSFRTIQVETDPIRVRVMVKVWWERRGRVESEDCLLSAKSRWERPDTN